MSASNETPNVEQTKNYQNCTILIYSRAKEQRKRTAKERQRCLRCKKRGHCLQECRELLETTTEENSGARCYNCGSTGHSLAQCKRTKRTFLKFATCFYCQEPGHLARDCPKNEKGLYTKGGGCFHCQSVRHTRSQCPKYLAWLRGEEQSQEPNEMVAEAGIEMEPEID